MSRIEKSGGSGSGSSGNTIAEDRHRDEVIQDIGTKTSKRHPKLNCFFLLLAVLVAFVMWIAWMVAATGLFYIPVLSSVAFHKPEPIRVVSPGTSVEVLAESTFKSVLAQRLQAGRGKLTDRTIELSIPESSLTASIRKSLETTTIDFIDPSGAQVAILPDQQFEIFLPLKNGAQKTAVTARINIAANKGVMTLTLKDVYVGSFHAPRLLVGSLVESYVNTQLASINQSLGSYMEVDALTYKQGSVLMSGVFTVQLK